MRLPQAKTGPTYSFESHDISEETRFYLLISVFTLIAVLFLFCSLLLCHRTRFWLRWVTCNVGASRRERAIEEGTRTPRRSKFMEELQAKWEESRRDRLRKSLLALEEELLQEAHLSWKERLEEREVRARHRKKQMKDKQKQLQRQIHSLRGRARLDLEEREREQRLEDLESSLEVRLQHLNMLEKEINEAMVDMRSRTPHSEDSLLFIRPLSGSREQLTSRSAKISGRMSPSRRLSDEYQKPLLGGKSPKTKDSVVQTPGAKIMAESPRSSKKSLDKSIQQRKSEDTKKSIEGKFSLSHTKSEKDTRHTSLEISPPKESIKEDRTERKSLFRKRTSSESPLENDEKSKSFLKRLSLKKPKESVQIPSTRSTVVEESSPKSGNRASASVTDNKDEVKPKRSEEKEAPKGDTERKKHSLMSHKRNDSPRPSGVDDSERPSFKGKSSIKSTKGAKDNSDVDDRKSAPENKVKQGKEKIRLSEDQSKSDPPPKTRTVNLDVSQIQSSDGEKKSYAGQSGSESQAGRKESSAKRTGAKQSTTESARESTSKGEDPVSSSDENKRDSVKTQKARKSSTASQPNRPSTASVKSKPKGDRNKSV